MEQVIDWTEEHIRGLIEGGGWSAGQILPSTGGCAEAKNLGTGVNIDF